MTTRLSQAIIPIALIAGLWSFFAHADQFHYHNILPGDRAMGLGGAFCAIADDASGMYYNPAGLAFSLANEVSGSANGFYRHKKVYENTLGTADFIEHSGGSHTPFFGGLQRMEETAPGLAMAFGIRVADADLKNQNDLVTNLQQSANQTINRFHRTVTERSSTNYIGIAFAKRQPSGRFSIGVSLQVAVIDELIQDYQDVDITVNGVQSLTMRNLRTHLRATVFEPSIGVQLAVTSSLSFGLVVKVPSIMEESYDFLLESINLKGGATPSRTVSDVTIDKPLGKPPTTVRAGIAHFASPRFLYSIDVIHNTAAKEGHPIFKREAITNYALGTEIFVSPSLPLRLGLFTNYDARPEIDENKSGQADHVDYYGGSIFLGYVQPNSQIAAGLILQNGEGKAQKLGNSNVQNVKAESQTLAISATHNF